MIEIKGVFSLLVKEKGGGKRGVGLQNLGNKVGVLVEHTWMTFLTKYRPQISSGSGGRRGKALKTAKKHRQGGYKGGKPWIS